MRRRVHLDRFAVLTVVEVRLVYLYPKLLEKGLGGVRRERGVQVDTKHNVSPTVSSDAYVLCRIYVYSESACV